MLPWCCPHRQRSGERALQPRTGAWLSRGLQATLQLQVRRLLLSKQHQYEQHQCEHRFRLGDDNFSLLRAGLSEESLFVQHVPDDEVQAIIDWFSQQDLKGNCKQLYTRPWKLAAAVPVDIFNPGCPIYL